MPLSRLGLILISLAGPLLAGEPLIKLAEDLDSRRKELVEISVQESAKHPDLPYLLAGDSPEDGGMDCSGAVFYLLGKMGIEPPRTADGQYQWVKASGQLKPVPKEAQSLDHPALKDLLPGDLLFWAPAEGDQPKISHVQIYLGREVRDGLAVMAGASDARSYRGVKRNGFGIVDFRIPKPDSPKRLIAYGPPVWSTGKKPAGR